MSRREQQYLMTESQKALVSKHHNLIYGFMRKHEMIRTDKTDVSNWYGILAIALIKAGHNWNEARGSFTSYAWGLMANAYKDEIKSKKASKRNGIVVSLDEPIGVSEGEEVCIGDIIPDESSENDLENYVINKIMFINVFAVLSQKEEVVIESKMNSHTNREIAQKLNCSEQNIGYMIRKIRKKISVYFD